MSCTTPLPRQDKLNISSIYYICTSIYIYTLYMYINIYLYIIFINIQYYLYTIILSAVDDINTCVAISGSLVIILHCVC